MKVLHLILFILLSSASNAPGQVGEIFGNVVDENREPIINALIYVTLSGSQKATTVSDFDGNFSTKFETLVIQIERHLYTIRVEYLGYKTEVVDSVMLDLNYMATVNFRLTRSVEPPRAKPIYSPGCYFGPPRKPLINRKVPGNITTIESKDLERMPY